MKKIIRSINIDITNLLSLEQVETINKTASLYAKAYNMFARVCCDIQSTNFNELHSHGYQAIRNEIPDLPSAILQCAGKNAGASVKSFNSNNKSKKWQFKGSHKGKNFKLNVCSLSRRGDLTTFSTVDKRIKVLHKLPKWFDEKYPSKRLYSGSVSIRNGNNVILNLSYDIGDVNLQTLDENTVIGIDRGIYHPIATSNGLLISSKESYAVKRRYAHNVSLLKQSSTSSSRRRLRSMSGKEKRFTNNYNHIISKRISELPNVSCVVLEDLNRISKRNTHSKKFNRWLHTWSFADLEFKIQYKCEAKGISVKYVNPYLTSQTCSCCGDSNSSYRNGNHFVCSKCGHREHSDINAAKNIRDKYLVNLRNWLRVNSTTHNASD